MQIIEGKKYFDAPPIYRLSDIIERAKTVYSDRTAVVYRENGVGDSKYVTYNDLYQQIKALKESLLGLGLGQENISLVGANSFEWILSYLSVVDGVGVICPLDAMLTGIEIWQLLLRSDSRALLADLNSFLALEEHLDESSPVQHWILTNYDKKKDQQALDRFKRKVESLGRKFYLLEDLIEDGRAKLENSGSSQDFPIPDNELAVLLFTSGTTADSKAVMLSNANITADIRALLETVKFADPLRTLSMLPLHHTFENTCGFLSVLSLGGQIHICDGLRHIAKNLKEYKIHMVIGVPKVFEAIYRRINQNIQRSGQTKKFKFGLALSKFLRFFGTDRRRKIFSNILDELGGDFYIAISGAAALDKEVIDFFYDIGVEILQGYGLTETSPVVAGGNTQYNVRGSCGQPLSGVKIAIDNTEKGEPGEILVQGDMVMLGYYQNEEANLETFTKDGWLKTGDIGYIDSKKKVLYLTGRTKSMIVLPSGKKVFPEELESLLNANDLVKDSLVFGQNEESGDVVITAKIVLDQDKIEAEKIDDEESIRKTLDQYIKEINKSLPSFKGIRSYAYSFQDMVKTTTLKVKRHVETERIMNLLNRGKLGWRDLIGVNLDLLESEINTEADEEEAALEKVLNLSGDKQVSDVRPESDVQHIEYSAVERPLRDFSSLSVGEVYQEKAYSIAGFDRNLKELKRKLDKDLAFITMKQGQAEDLLYMEEDKKRRDLQRDYQVKIKQLHEEYNQQLMALRAEFEAESLARTNDFQVESNELNKDFYIDLRELNRNLPKKTERSAEENALSKKADQKTKSLLKENHREDKAERKSFRKALKSQHKRFRDKVKQRRKDQKDLYKHSEKELRLLQEEDRLKLEKLQKEIDKALSQNKQRHQALVKEHNDILKSLKEKNDEY